jgi:hypothetical protein
VYQSVHERRATNVKLIGERSKPRPDNSEEGCPAEHFVWMQPANHRSALPATYGRSTSHCAVLGFAINTEGELSLFFAVLAAKQN